MRYAQQSIIRVLSRLAATLALAAGLSLGLAACDVDEGPVEETGEAIDEAGDEVEEGVDELD